MALSIFRKFARDKRGNMTMIFAIATLPLVFAMGMGVDYTSASRKKTKLNAAADAAALAAVTPTMLSQPIAAAKSAAQSMFNAQIAGISGLNPSSVGLTVAITDSGTISHARTAVVTYTASSQNAFGGLLKMNSLTIAGGSTATVSAAPNIDFYLLLDTSPSMALPATSAGITSMISHTQNQTDTVNGKTIRGCAFACHQSNPSADGLGNPGGEDNYALARNLGLTLRIDNVVAAASNLTSTAQTTEKANGAAYRMALYTFDIAVNTIKTLTSNLATVGSAANTSNIQVLEVYDNNYLTKNNNNNDSDTDWDNAMSALNQNMPAPGNGTNIAGDTPQEVLFLVTDGVRDEMDTIFGVSSRAQTVMYDAKYDWCTTIKNRGIRIAVLYTTYLSLYNESSWYNSYIYPFQSSIGPTLQSCASPGLYSEVSTDQDITQALGNLFKSAVSTAHLTQ